MRVVKVNIQKKTNKNFQLFHNYVYISILYNDLINEYPCNLFLFFHIVTVLIVYIFFYIVL